MKMELNEDDFNLVDNKLVTVDYFGELLTFHNLIDILKAKYILVDNVLYTLKESTKEKLLKGDYDE
jgi:hypothetical protein